MANFKNKISRCRSTQCTPGIPKKVSNYNLCLWVVDMILNTTVLVLLWENHKLNDPASVVGWFPTKKYLFFVKMTEWSLRRIIFASGVMAHTKAQAAAANNQNRGSGQVSLASTCLSFIMFPINIPLCKMSLFLICSPLRDLSLPNQMFLGHY